MPKVMKNSESLGAEQKWLEITWKQSMVFGNGRALDRRQEFSQGWLLDKICTDYITITRRVSCFQ